MEYSVQKILDKMIDPISKKQLFLIKWQGYDISYASWEPYEHVKDNCQTMLAQFEAQFGEMITTAIGKIYVPQSDNKNNDNDTDKKNTPKQNQTKKIKKQNIRSLVRFNGRSYFGENSIKIKSQRQQNEECGRKQQNSIKRRKLSYSNEAKNATIFQQGKEVLLQNFRTITRRNSLNLIQTKSNTSSRKNSIRDKQLNQIKTKIYIQKQQRNNQHNGHNGHNGHESERNRRIIKRFTPIIIENAVPKSSRKISMHQQKTNQSELVDDKQKQKAKIERRDFEQAIDIIGMRKSEKGYQFYVRKNGKNFWVEHSELFNNYSKQLCLFYERNLILS